MHTLLFPMSESLIQNPTSLARVCESLQNQPWMALDTEFMRTNTYYARLCLVQVATPEIIACIDTIALPTIEPMLELIYSPKVLKVIHSARQDLEVFADMRGAPPAPVFDTQIAASLCGYDDQIGYGALVESITGHKLPKLHTRADWETRPLPPDQLHYAEDDVRYLRDVYQFLAQKLDDLGRTDWLREECATLTSPGLYRNDPREAFRRLKQGQSLPTRCADDLARTGGLARANSAAEESAAQLGRARCRTGGNGSGSTHNPGVAWTNLRHRRITDTQVGRRDSASYPARTGVETRTPVG